MSTYWEHLRIGAIVVAMVGVTYAAAAVADSVVTSVRLLSAQFEPRQVVQVEAGDFHFLPGQVAPIHTHTAPAIGYVTKGTIIYQVEGGAVQILREGDAFYEPAGPRILRFDNGSATEEAVFVDFNLEQPGEPFIVFEEPPTEAIDRRTLPTVALDGATVERADIFESDLAPSGTLDLATGQPTLGLVGQGVVEVRIEGEPARRVVAGETFALPTSEGRATIINLSPEVAAKVITFRLG